MHYVVEIRNPVDTTSDTAGLEAEAVSELFAQSPFEVSTIQDAHDYRAAQAWVAVCLTRAIMAHPKYPPFELTVSDLEGVLARWSVQLEDAVAATGLTEAHGASGLNYYVLSKAVADVLLPFPDRAEEQDWVRDKMRLAVAPYVATGTASA